MISITPASVQAGAAARHSVFATSVGAAVNGAASVISLSRCGTVAFGSPPSSASTHAIVAGTFGCQRHERGPGSTPPFGTVSATGRSAIVFTTPPLRSHTSTAVGKSSYGTSHENGRLTRAISTKLPSGEGAKVWKMPGRPSGVRAPDTASTTASWLVA